MCVCVLMAKLRRARFVRLAEKEEREKRAKNKSRTFLLQGTTNGSVMQQRSRLGVLPRAAVVVLLLLLPVCACTTARIYDLRRQECMLQMVLLFFNSTKKIIASRCWDERDREKLLTRFREQYGKGVVI